MYMIPTVAFGPAPVLAAVAAPVPGLDAGRIFELAWALATNPLTGHVLGMLVSFLVYILLRDQHAREWAQAGADYLEAFERQAVIAAELAGWIKGIKGYDKLLFALDFVEGALAKQGITGDADRVNRERITADLKRIKDELFPGTGTTIEQLEALLLRK